MAHRVTTNVKDVTHHANYLSDITETCRVGRACLPAQLVEWPEEIERQWYEHSLLNLLISETGRCLSAEDRHHPVRPAHAPAGS